MDAERTAPSVLPVLYGPTTSLHVGARATAPWRISTAQAVRASRFDWSIDVERRRARVGDLTMVYERSRRRLAGGNFLPRPPRSAAWQAAVTYRVAAMNGHPLAIFGKTGAERRAPVAVNDRGRAQQVRTSEIDLIWYPVGGLSLGGGWKSQDSASRRRGIDRAISIASGNPISETGPKLQLGFDQGGGDLASPAWHLGIDAGAYRLAARDIAALGSPDRLDERVTLSLRVALR
jgi:hypothetical protein